MSLFAKLFGRNKKKAPPPPSPKPAVEYATFSAQFPPPEWTWYQQQLEKHIRTETWVQQQVVKSGTWHHFQNIQQDIDVDCHAASEGGTNQAVMKQDTRGLDDDNIKRELKRHSSRIKTRHKDKPSMVIANKQRERLASDNMINTVPKNVATENPGQRLRLSSLPTRLSPPGAINLPHSDDVHPMFNSTPRYMSSYQNQHDHLDNTVDQIQANIVDPYIKRTSVRKSHKSKRRSHHEYHSGFNPTCQNQDINYEYNGRLPKKNSTIGMSRDSGVNCVGLDSKQNEVREHKVSGVREHRVRAQKPCHHRETKIDPDLTARNDYDHCSNDKVISGQDQHIYANVQISNPSASHSSTKRVIERPSYIEKDRQRRSASYRHYKSEKKKQSQNKAVERLHLDSHVMDCYKTELNKLCSETHEKVQVEPVSSQKKISQDSAVEGTCSSEHSLGTVINTKTERHKQIENLIAETRLSHGDSGFSSPRFSEVSSDSRKNEGISKKNESKSKTYEKESKSENQTKTSKHDSKRKVGDITRESDSKKNDSNLLREKQSFMCNNIKNSKPLNNSMGDLDSYSSDTILGTITPDALYENVKLDHAEVLNNMKYLHKEITVSSQNLNTPVPDVTAEAVETDIKQPVIGKFNLEGDFHVVGVV